MLYTQLICQHIKDYCYHSPAKQIKHIVSYYRPPISYERGKPQSRQGYRLLAELHLNSQKLYELLQYTMQGFYSNCGVVLSCVPCEPCMPAQAWQSESEALHTTIFVPTGQQSGRATQPTEPRIIVHVNPVCDLSCALVSLLLTSSQ